MTLTIKSIKHAIALVFKDGVLVSGSVQTEDLVLAGERELGRINLKTTEFTRSDLETWNDFINPVPAVEQPTSTTEDATTKATDRNETNDNSSTPTINRARNQKSKATA